MQTDGLGHYGQAHVDFYDLFGTGVPGDVEFYTEQARGAGSPVLELGCGTGRILIPIAESGLQIVGLDCSAPMLSIAGRKVSKLSDAVQRRIELVEGDMRDFSLGRRFGLVMIPYRAFLSLLTTEDQREALTCIREHLTDDGRLILNIFDPRLDMVARRSEPLTKRDEFVHPETGNQVVYWASCERDPERQVLEETWIFEEINAARKVISRTRSPLVLRWIYRYEMEYLLELCGYKIEALYGDFQRGPFRYGGEQIWIASKGVDHP